MHQSLFVVLILSLSLYGLGLYIVGLYVLNIVCSLKAPSSHHPTNSYRKLVFKVTINRLKKYWDMFLNILSNVKNAYYQENASDYSIGYT